jgi:energy-coupling factor transporter ATP-binding protein EcfA2/ribosomal protein L37AE/L43A
MISRPYIDFTGQALRKLYQESLENEPVLAALSVELNHRNVPSMRKLRTEVETTLRQARRCIPGSHGNDPPVPGLECQPRKTEVTPGGEDPPAADSPYFVGPIVIDPENEVDDDVEGEGENLGARSSVPHSSIRACGALRDVPNRWTRPMRRDIELGLSPKASRVDRFIAALRALVKDMRRKGTGVRTVNLQNGEAIELDGLEQVYRFPYDGDAELFEGAKVTISVGSRTCDGSIASISSQWLIISLEEDFGKTITFCVLRIDNTAMLDALADRLEKARTGETRLNSSIAEEVLDNSGESAVWSVGDHNLPSFLELNPRQQYAVNHMIANRVTYLWGPPGTGKTQTLAVFNQLLYEESKRVLLCSNTNQAVDQVLKKLCETFGTEHPALVDGKVLRIGKAEGIPDRFADYVTLDGIVRRRSADLQERKRELQKAVDEAQFKAESAKEIVERFRALDKATLERDLLIGRRAETTKALDQIEIQQVEMKKKLAVLERELDLRTAAGPIRRLILRNERSIRADLAACVVQEAGLQAAAEKKRSELHVPDLSIKFEEMTSQCERLTENLKTNNRVSAEGLIRETDVTISRLLHEIGAINSQINDMAKSVVAGARIVGATVTKTFLSPQHFGNFDTVVVDEASMVILPALYYVSGLAKEKVIISGDFRQLPPIVQTDQQAILEIIGSDVFSAAGIPLAVIKGKTPKRTVMLEEQYRMPEGICALISRRMYEGKLVTSRFRNIPGESLPAPFDSELTIIDTSSIQPFVTRFGTSRYNLMNALTVRNLVRFLSDREALSDKARTPAREFQVGICTPFAAQKELLKRLVVKDGVLVGTVHRYQGDEKRAMIIDIPDSLGERYVSMFAQAASADEAGSQLFNVAVSRAQAQIIFIANLDYLDRKLPGDAFLREILCSATRLGKIIDVKDVIALWPIVEDLREYGRPFDIDPEALSTGLFDQSSFDVVFRADVAKAKRGVAIYSGFITPQRVGAYEALFRSKTNYGVEIRCVTRPPSRNGSISPDLGRDALNGLEAMGCTVDTRWEIHQKVVIIDDEIVWFGSLNPLSHTNRTDETMLRLVSRPAALQMAAFLSVTEKMSAEKAEGLAVCGENPRCNSCNSRTTYRQGKWGPYWECEDKCGWTESLKAHQSSITPLDGQGSTTENPSCPKCKAQTVSRRGPYGPFWGCSRYPACDGLVKSRARR